MKHSCKGQRLSLRNNYLALITALLLFLSAGAQDNLVDSIARVDTSRKYQDIKGDGFNWKGGRFVNILRAPHGLPNLSRKDSGAIAWYQNHFWQFSNEGFWDTLSGSGGSGGPTKVYVKRPLTVDETTNPGFQTLGELHDDGLISGGIVTSAGCLLLHVTPAFYYLNNGTGYFSAGTDLTVSTPDPSLPRTDRIVVDTNGIVTIIPGMPSISPQAPPYNRASQWSIATYPVGAGATCLAINSIVIYDETGGTEYTPSTHGSITADPADPANPEHLTVAYHITMYADGSKITFKKTSGQDTVFNNSVFRFGLYINNPLLNTVEMQTFLAGVPTTSSIVINPYISVFDTLEYQTVGVPGYAFGASGNIIEDSIVFTFRGADTSGASGLFFDWFQLQTGLTNTAQSIYLTTDSTSGPATLVGNHLNIPNYATGGGGGGVWGTITGTLSDQTDLQSALTALVPKTTTITINGTTQNLSANRTWNVGTLVAADTISLSNRINLKVNISDTASMLSHYLRSIDTTGKWVNNVIKVNDSTIRVLKGAGGTDLLIRGNGAGGNQNLLQVTGVDSLTTHNMVSGDTSKNFTWYRDSIFYKKNFANITTGLKGAKIWQLKTEKYGNTYDGIGIMGEWNSYLLRNYYNAGTRPGEILYMPTYNMNDGGSALVANEGGILQGFESDFNRKFEYYLQVAMKNGFVYRPLMMVANKDTLLGEFAYHTPYFHAMPIDTADDYFSAKNGILSIYKVTGRASEVSGAALRIGGTNGLPEILLLNNGGGLLFGGSPGGYLFDKPIAPTSNNLTDLGNVASSWWRHIYSSAASFNSIAVPDANYTQLITDHTLNFKNITANRTLTLITSTYGTRLEIITGQATFKVTFSGATVKTIDGTTITEIPAGKSCVMHFDGTNWQVISYSNLSAGGSGTVTSIATTSPITGGTITATGTIGITAMDATHDGYVAAGGNANKILHGDGTWKDTTVAGGTTLSGTGLVSMSGSTPAYNTTSSSIAGIISDETGSGAMVFGTSPAITTSLTTPSTTFSLANTTATTVNAFGAATTLNMGAASSTWNIGDNTTINSTGANADVTIQGTSNGTRATSYVNLQPNGGNVGIGTSAPSSLLHVAGNTNAALAMLFQNSNSGTNAYAGIQLQNNSASSYLYLTSSGYSTGGGLANELYIQNATGGGVQLYDGTIAYRLSGSTSGVGATGATPTSTFGVDGSFATKYTATATGITALTHGTIAVTATGQTITLPTAVGISGRHYTIKLTASGSGTVNTTSSQTIDGSTTYSLSAQWKYVTVQSDGANWLIIANN